MGLVVHLKDHVTHGHTATSCPLSSPHTKALACTLYVSRSSILLWEAFPRTPYFSRVSFSSNTCYITHMSGFTMEWGLCELPGGSLVP